MLFPENLKSVEIQTHGDGDYLVGILEDGKKQKYKIQEAKEEINELRFVEKEKTKEKFFLVEDGEYLEKKLKNEDYNFSNHVFLKSIKNNKPIKEISFFGAIFAKKVDFFSTVFEGRTNFEELTFIDEVNFRKVTFKKEAIFRCSTFNGEADFHDTIFSEKADFYSTTFRKEAKFSSAKFKEAIFSIAKFAEKVIFLYAKFAETAKFSSIEFKGEVEFVSAQFQEEANFSLVKFLNKVFFSDAEFTDKADFSDTKFTKEANFSDIKFKGEVEFINARFKEKVDFHWTFFIEKSNFVDAEFGEVDFKRVTFIQNVNFLSTKFTKKVNFAAAIFKGKPAFSFAMFTEKVNFAAAIFEEEVAFSFVMFTEKVNFELATFKGEVNFGSATFNEKADFENVTFSEKADFRRVTFIKEADFSSIIISESSSFDFRGAIFDDKFILNLSPKEEESEDKKFKVLFEDVVVEAKNFAFSKEIVEHLSDESDRYVFLNMKNAALARQDNITALELHKREYDTHYRYLEKRKKQEKYKWDFWILKFEKCASDFGTNIVNSTTYFFLSYFLFSLAIFFVTVKVTNSIDLSSILVYTLKPITFFPEDMKNSNFILFSILIVLKILRTMFAGILAYEVIKSFRKFSRKL